MGWYTYFTVAMAICGYSMLFIMTIDGWIAVSDLLSDLKWHCTLAPWQIMSLQIMFLQINIAVHQVKKTATGEERKTALPNWQEKAITPHRLPRRDYSINGQRWQVQSWNSKFNDGPCRPSEMWLDVSHQFWCAEFGLERWQLKLYSASIGWSNLAVSAAGRFNELTESDKGLRWYF